MLLSSSTVLVLATFLLGVISLICRSLLWAVARQHFCTKINRPLQMFGKDHVHSNLKVPSMMVYHPIYLTACSNALIHDSVMSLQGMLCYEYA